MPKMIADASRIAFLIFFLSSCGLHQEIISPQPSITPTYTFTSTPSPSPTSAFISSPTITLAPTSTPLPPLPTISASEAKNLISSLLKNNANCQLPCWWGVTPGKTSWPEAERYLSTFALSVGDLWNDNGNDYQSVTIYFPSPIEASYINYLEQEYRIRGNKVIAINTYNYKLTSTFYLSKVLTNYGQPDAVGLSTYAQVDTYMGGRPTSLVIFYQDKGIMIEYVGAKSVDNIDDYIRICPDGTYNFFYVWDPSLKLSFDDAITWFGVAASTPYPLQLQKASNMSIADFYHTYKNPNANICIDSPIELWPNS